MVASKRQRRAPLQTSEARVSDHFDFFPKPKDQHMKSVKPNIKTIDDLRRIRDVAELVYPVEVPVKRGELLEFFNAEQMQRYLDTIKIRLRSDSPDEDEGSQREEFASQSSPGTLTLMASSRASSESIDEAYTDKTISSLLSSLSTAIHAVSTELDTATTQPSTIHVLQKNLLRESLQLASHTSAAVLLSEDDSTESHELAKFVEKLRASIETYYNKLKRGGDLPMGTGQVGLKEGPREEGATSANSPQDIYSGGPQQRNDTPVSIDQVQSGETDQEPSSTGSPATLEVPTDTSGMLPICAFCGHRPHDMRIMSCKGFACLSCHKKAEKLAQKDGNHVICPACRSIYERSGIVKSYHCHLRAYPLCA
ncbi:hypothetical protein N0V90_005622 [Kalmusia sp. IMI 367209]|nr:hypothetical protein N0V90_005622 [Kalmusia sp. IMI 367209]